VLAYNSMQADLLHWDSRLAVNIMLPNFMTWHIGCRTVLLLDNQSPICMCMSCLARKETLPTMMKCMMP